MSSTFRSTPRETSFSSSFPFHLDDIILHHVTCNRWPTDEPLNGPTGSLKFIPRVAHTTDDDNDNWRQKRPLQRRSVDDSSSIFSSSNSHASTSFLKTRRGPLSVSPFFYPSTQSVTCYFSLHYRTVCLVHLHLFIWIQKLHLTCSNNFWSFLLLKLNLVQMGFRVCFVQFNHWHLHLWFPFHPYLSLFVCSPLFTNIVKHSFCICPFFVPFILNWWILDHWNSTPNLNWIERENPRIKINTHDKNINKRHGIT